MTTGKSDPRRFLFVVIDLFFSFAVVNLKVSFIDAMVCRVANHSNTTVKR